MQDKNLDHSYYPSWLPQSVVLEKYLVMVKIDFRKRQVLPSTARVILASMVAVVLSLVADAACVKVAETLYPSTIGFVHFRFFDYASLTIIGVIGACVGWYVLLQVSSEPKWVYLRSAVLLTLVLYVPDLWIWVIQHEQLKAVLALMVMHFLIAVVTYNSMVRLAPAKKAYSGERTFETEKVRAGVD
jgi:hypothetical protein